MVVLLHGLGAQQDPQHDRQQQEFGHFHIYHIKPFHTNPLVVVCGMRRGEIRLPLKPILM